MSSSPYEALIQGDASPSRTIAARLSVTLSQFVDWKWQLKNQITTAADASRLIMLTADEEAGFCTHPDQFKVGVTPYYLGLMHPTSASCPLRLQAIPCLAEFTNNSMSDDPLNESSQSPVAEVIHIYPDRVAFCVAGLCATYCRFCFRKRRKASGTLHFNKEIVARGISYIQNNPAIRDVLITGGDPFMADDAAIASLLTQLRAIKHVELIRIGSRMPVTLPYRITPELCKTLKKFKPLWVSTHFNCPEEITPEARIACELLVDHGIPVSNQSVFLRGVNDKSDRLLALSRGLLSMGVRPYYIFHPHAVAGTAHLHITVDQGLNIMKNMRGKITGLGIPTYALDTPAGKIPLQHNYILGRDGNDLILETLRGEIHRERAVLDATEP